MYGFKFMTLKIVLTELFNEFVSGLFLNLAILSIYSLISSNDIIIILLSNRILMLIQ